MEAGQKRDPAE